MTATPIVGREVELDQLDRQLKRALDGQTTNCFVTGEPGAGKSSLVMEFARRAQEGEHSMFVPTCGALRGSIDDAVEDGRVGLSLRSYPTPGRLD